MKVSAFLWFVPKNLALKKAPAIPPRTITIPRTALVFYMIVNNMRKEYSGVEVGV